MHLCKFTPITLTYQYRHVSGPVHDSRYELMNWLHFITRDTPVERAHLPTYCHTSPSSVMLTLEICSSSKPPNEYSSTGLADAHKLVEFVKWKKCMTIGRCPGGNSGTATKADPSFAILRSNLQALGSFTSLHAISKRQHLSEIPSSGRNSSNPSMTSKEGAGRAPFAS